LIVKAVLVFTAPKFWGEENLEEGILEVEGMAPMGAGLHEPVFTCCPLVMGRLAVKQKLIKLFVEVREAT
jgi:hypothetical protein